MATPPSGLFHMSLSSSEPPSSEPPTSELSSPEPAAVPTPTADARLRTDLAALLSRVPAGYVAAIGDVSRHLRAYQPHVAQILAELGDADATDAPWWRVVADGGAIGRHARRDKQMSRLRADGVPLSPAGIVQEFADRRVKDLTNPPAAPLAPSHPSGIKPARSRGMKSHPGA